MRDAELIEFATEFRAGVLNGRPSKWSCAMICWPLATLLNMHGIKCESVETDLGEMNHIWLRLADGRALDPTLDQFNYLFNENFPEVYLGPPTKYHGAFTSTESKTIISLLGGGSRVTFRVGQKVACIAPKCGDRFDVPEPDLGDICTIVNIYENHNGLILELAEFPAPACARFDAGWLAEDFRPLVERKADISIFTKMLIEKRVPALASPDRNSPWREIYMGNAEAALAVVRQWLNPVNETARDAERHDGHGS